MKGKPEIVSVFGSGDPRPGDAEYAQAEAVGAALAGLGYTLANGGYGGTMEASARGASQAGGRAIGVTCTIWSSKPNAMIAEEIRTESYRQRLDTLITLAGGGYVVLPGATGTLVEVATVWEMACKKLTEPRPIVLMGAFWRPMVELMASARPGCEAAVHLAESPDELARWFPQR